MNSYEFSLDPKPVPAVHTNHRRIHTDIPATGTKALLARLDAVESRSMHGQLPIVWDRAHDFSVWDIAGNRFIDFTSGIFVASVGHGNERVMDAVSRVQFLHSYTYATDMRAKYLEKLTSWSGFDKAFLLSSGTEATEAALKLMRMYGAKTGRRKIVCFDGAFHGRTMGAQLMGARMDWTARDPDIVHEHLGKNIFLNDACGVMIETFEGWSATFHNPVVIKAVAEVCRSQDTVVCFDEMQAGFARTGRKFGYEHYGVTPDLICVGKGMGGGVPLSGVLGRAEIMDLPEVGEMSSTHSANPLVCAAGLAVLEEIERLDLVNEAERKGLLLYAELEKLLQRFPNRISCLLGNGLIGAVLFGNPGGALFASRVAERCMEKGLLVVHTGRESIKIGPPLTIPDDALLEGVQVLGEAIAEIDAEAR